MFKKIVLLASVVATLMFPGARAASAQNETHAVYAELMFGIDTHTAKIGDLISAELRDSIRFKDGTRLPEGTLLTGHIVALDPAGTSFSLLFDRAQIASQEPSKVSVVVRRLESAPASTEDTPEDSNDIKISGDPVSKIRGVIVSNSTDGSTSAIFSSKGKSLHLDYRTLLGCLVSL